MGSAEAPRESPFGGDCQWAGEVAGGCASVVP